MKSVSILTAFFFFIFQDEEVDESGDEAAGDHIRTSQTNGADEWVMHLKSMKLICNTEYLKICKYSLTSMIWLCFIWTYCLPGMYKLLN